MDTPQSTTPTRAYTIYWLLPAQPVGDDEPRPRSLWQVKVYKPRKQARPARQRRDRER